MLEAMKCRSESSCLESCDRLLSSASPNQVIFVSNFVLSHLRHQLPPQRLNELRARLIGYKVPARTVCDVVVVAFSALMLLVGRQEGYPAGKNKWWGAGMVICLERGADLHMAQLMPLPLTVSCFVKLQISFTFLVPAYRGSPRQRAVKRACVCVVAVVVVVKK